MANYFLNLNENPYKLICDNKKTLELRLNDNRRKNIKENDYLIFTNTKTKSKLKCKVIKIFKYDSFEELYKAHDKKEMGYDKDEIASPDDMLKYYKKEDIIKYGVLGIKIEKIGEIKMSYEIRYFTKSKKGNTKKLADAIGEALNITPLDITHKLDSYVDILFFVNAMYAFDVDEKIKEFIKENKDNIGMIVNFNTAASGKSTLGYIKKVALPLNVKVCDEDFHCAGSWIFINKGKPTEDDLNKAKEFAKKFIG